MKKKILVVIKEDSAYGAKKYIEKLRSEGIECLPFFIQPYDSLIEHHSISIFDDAIHFNQYFNDKNYEFKKNLTNLELDYINGWINSSVLNQRGSTGRNWSSSYKFSDIINYLNDCGSFYEWVINKYKPTAIVDFESDNIIRAVLDLICIRNNLSYFVYYSTRLDGRVAIGKGIISPIFRAPIISEHDINCATDLIDNYVIDAKLSHDEVLFDKRNSEYGLFSLIIEVIRNISFHSKISLKKILNRNIKASCKDLYYGGGFSYLLWKINFIFRKFFDINFYGSNISRTNYGGNYFYFALGQTIEGSEPNFSGGFLNDIECLNFVKSKINCHRYRFLVKDHRSMLGDRSRSQRNFIDSMNIDYVWGRQLCSYEWTSHPQSLVFNSIGVFTLSGSVGLEALLSNVPAFIFGEPLYKKIMRKNGIKFAEICDIDKFLEFPNIFLPDRHLLTISIAELISISRKYSLYQLKRCSYLVDNDYLIDNAVSHLLFEIE